MPLTELQTAVVRRGLELLRDDLIRRGEETYGRATEARRAAETAKALVASRRAALIEAENALSAASRHVAELDEELIHIDRDKTQVLWLLREGE